MTIPIAPETRILQAARDAIAASSVKTTFNRPDMVIRHSRHRTITRTQEGVSVRFVESTVREEAGDMFTHSEVAWAMALDIVCDLNLTPEPDDEAAPSSDDADITGWDHLSSLARYCANVLIDPDPASSMRQLVDDILPGDIDPDEDAQPDKGRLVISVIVLYRTRYDDMMQLLSPTGNA